VKKITASLREEEEENTTRRQLIDWAKKCKAQLARFLNVRPKNNEARYIHDVNEGWSF
jgi:hypothetical protein